MPKVKLHTTYAHPQRGCHQDGAEIHVPDDEAEQLVNGGFASLCDGEVITKPEAAEAGEEPPAGRSRKQRETAADKKAPEDATG